MMKITVIVCTYNRCKSLPEALESIVASELPASVEWEVLVVDNNSSDQTRKVVEDFCGRYPGRLRYLFEPQPGLSNARNAGIQAALGEVLVFTDDDVTVEPAWLQNLTSSLLNGHWTGSGGRIVPVWQRPIPPWLSTDDPHTMGPFVAFDAGPAPGPLTRPPYGANMAFRKEMFQKYGNFRSDLGRGPNNMMGQEDIEFAQRLLDGGESLRYEPFAVVYHPVPENRLKKRFVRRWWFWYGYSEVVQFGPPSTATWRISGVPVYLAHRLVRWALQWMITVNRPRRFSCERKVWYIAGTIFACHRRPRGNATYAPPAAPFPCAASESAPESRITS